MKTQVIYEPATETAKKIRKALKAVFPQTKFSVTSKTFSGGDSVSIRWTDLPLTEDVQAITSKFESGHYNGYEDIYESGSYSYEGKLYNGAKYIQCSRNLSDEYKETVNEYLNTHFEVSNMDSWELNRFFNQAEKEMNTPVEVVEVEENEITETEQKETSSPSISLTVELNEELNGIELYFSSKPSQNVISILKDAKFRWHKKGYWYAKQSPERIAIVEGIQSILTDVNKEIERVTIETMEQIDVVAPEQILITDSNLIGRKVFGQWGVMAGWDNGIITGETIYNEIVIKWEDGHQEYFELKNLVYVHENTNMDAIGVYLLPIENNEPVNVIEETPVNEPTEITYNNDNKIKVSSIRFEWSESNVIADGQIVSTFEEAEHLIKLAAHKAPSDGCYDKTKFTLTWTDGNTYTGRIDIVKSDSFKSTPLKDHISYFAKSVIEDDGTWHTDEQKEEYRQFLETYSLEDEKEEIPLTNENKQSGKVLDFSAKFKAKQEKKETQEMTTHFIDNVLPYLNMDEITEIKNAYESKNENELDAVWQKLMMITAIRRAKDEILNQS